MVIEKSLWNLQLTKNEHRVLYVINVVCYTIRIGSTPTFLYFDLYVTQFGSFGSFFRDRYSTCTWIYPMILLICIYIAWLAAWDYVRTFSPWSLNMCANFCSVCAPIGSTFGRRPTRIVLFVILQPASPGFCTALRCTNPVPYFCACWQVNGFDSKSINIEFISIISVIGIHCWFHENIKVAFELLSLWVMKNAIEIFSNLFGAVAIFTSLA